MAGWVGPRMRWAGGMLPLAVLALSGACGGEAPPEQPPEVFSDVAEVPEQVADPGPPPLRRFLPDELRRSTQAETFAHDAHVGIDCAVCHQVAAGHGSHGTVECADCHRAGALVVASSVSPDDCQACHHAAEQPLECTYCHETRDRLTSAQALFLEVWTSSRVRELTFDHAVHAGEACTMCHREAPALTPAEGCASCHADHHTTGVRCVACHEAPPESAHDLEAHLTCSGAGCHRDQPVEAIAGTRSVCVSCHRDLEEHEPEGACIECHRVRGNQALGGHP